jgi:GAF domain
MSTHSSLDRESFQQLLASTFAVQESEMDTRSLSLIVEVQRLITRGDLDVDGAMHQIVDSARNVANATGVAIGLFKGNRLVYRAGSGSAATYIGRQVAASLTVSADTKASREILRVENTQTDTRIEAAICRQFGAKSLLILPIYHDRAVVGVLEVLFCEAHNFQGREVRTYRLMAELIGEAMSHAAQLEQGKKLTTEPKAIPRAIEHSTHPPEKLPNDGARMPDPANKRGIYQPRWTSVDGRGELPVLRQPALLATLIQRAKRVPWRKVQWNVALAAVVTVFAIACWIAYSGRGPASPLASPALERSTPIEEQVRLEAAKAMLASAKEVEPAKTALRRVRVGENEVDYVGEDVTIRYFTSKPAPRRRVGESQVAYIGNDVTVHYFRPKPAAMPAVGRAARPAGRAWPDPAQSASQKPAKERE